MKHVLGVEGVLPPLASLSQLPFVFKLSFNGEGG